MQTQVTKKIDFSGKDLFIGLDVHKKSWSVTIVVDGIEHRTFTQPPDPGALKNYLQKMYPGGSYNSAYEAGFCGYGIHRELNSLGIRNIVINAADIPTSQKDKLQKRDPVDSRKIARSLEKGSLRGIHIFDRELEELRSLNRTRFYLMRDLRRSKTRIKSFLQYYREPMPQEFDNNQWTLKFVSWLKQVKMHIESSWQAIRMDPAMMQYYHSHLINNKGHKVVIKVARKLLNRIRYVMKNRKPYITGVA